MKRLGGYRYRTIHYLLRKLIRGGIMIWCIIFFLLGLIIGYAVACLFYVSGGD